MNFAPLDSSALTEIDLLLDRVGEAARAEIPESDFQVALLTAAVQATGGVGGLLWSGSMGPAEPPLAQLGFQGSGPASGGSVSALVSSQSHRQVIWQVAQENRPRQLAPGQWEGAQSTAANPTSWVALLAPVASSTNECPVVLETLVSASVTPSAQRLALDLLAEISAAAASWYDRQRIRSLEGQLQQQQKWSETVDRLHRSLDLKEVAFAVANEGRSYLDCDRLSVVDFQRGRAILLAVSGQEAIDDRSPLVRAIEQLARDVIRGQEPLWYPDDAGRIAPQLESQAQTTCDLGASRQIAVLPLVHEQRAAAETRQSSTGVSAAASAIPDAIGALVVERFRDDPGIAPASRQTAAHFASQAALALGNCHDFSSVPFHTLLAPLGRSGWLRTPRRRPALLILAGILALLAILCVFPAELTVSGTGTLQPQTRSHVFALSDGIVAQVLTAHGQRCQAGEVLLRLSKSQLELEQTRVTGEMQTAQRRLASIEALRLQAEPQTAADREKFNQIAAEELELRETLQGLVRQRKILDLQQDELLVRSPIDGQIVTWDVRDLLLSRPVQKGEQLLTVADLEGAWILEIDVPDDQIAPVLDARKRSGEQSLVVSFMLATEPGVTHRGTVERIAMAAEPDRTSGQRVRVVVAIPENSLAAPRPGAMVVPRIHCGKRALGYVWFHSAWETIQKHVLF